MRSIVVLMMALAVSCACAAAQSQTSLTGMDTKPFRRVFGTLPPTPQGTGYVTLESGEYVCIRYALPSTRPVSYKLDFHNIRALSGNGISYMVQLRRESSTGPLIYEGPVCNATFMNAANYEPLEVSERITDEDCAAGYLDVYATVHCTGDKWVLYRDAQEGDFRLRCPALTDSPALRALASRNEWMRREGIDLLPMPRSVKPAQHPLVISVKSRIVLAGHPSKEDEFAADLLRQEIRRLSGHDIPVRKSVTGQAGDLILTCQAEPGSDQSYHIKSDGILRADAPTSTGLFYAIQTIIQLLQSGKDGVRIPGVVIDDLPALAHRMVQYDLAREQTVSMAYMKRMVREMARLKLNQLMIYMEDDFRFTEFPFTGRPGTFTPQTARELVQYAQRYHVEVVPQLESFGHGNALLSHPEFADLRENGDPWTFCTTNPRTWTVLDKMYKELASVFGNTPYLHVGADEFEPTFGKCESCKKEIGKSGWGGLYAMHINRLNAICKKLGRTMVFWTAHGAWQPELGPDLTIRYADLLDKDCIPMEWVYLGPEDYPSIDKLQKAGFRGVYAASTVLGYGTICPNNPISVWNIDTFCRKAIKDRLDGLCNSTWELRLGDHFENTWYGHACMAQASWSGFTPDDRCLDASFARHWLGIRGDLDSSKVARVFRMTNGSGSDSVFGPGGVSSRELFWTKAKELKPQAGVAWPILVARQAAYDHELAQMLSDLDSLREASARNTETLDSLRQVLLMYRLTLRRVGATEEASRLLESARRADDPASELRKAADVLESVLDGYAEISKSMCVVRDSRGGSPEDVNRVTRMAASVREQVSVLRKLADSVSAGDTTAIPEAKKLGL